MRNANSDIVLQSYGRCCRDEQFFEHFYNVFRSKSEDIRNMFTHTDMTEQRRLLRAGITWMIMHARGGGRSKLESLGKSHNRHGYNVPPALYRHWLDALMESVAAYDPHYDATLEQHWRGVMTPGIEVIASAW